MEKILSKFVGILLVFVLFNSFNICYSNDVVLPENLKKQMLRLKEDIKKAAASGDIEAYKKVKNEYMQLINKDPELKKAFAETIKVWPTEEKGIIFKKFGPDIKTIARPYAFIITPEEISEMCSPRKYAIVIYADKIYYYVAKYGASLKETKIYGIRINGKTGEIIYPTKRNEYSIKETNKEVIIEFAYYEGVKNQKTNFSSGEKAMELINKKQLIKRVSCLCKFNGEINKITSVQNSYGMLVVDGKAIKEKGKKNKKDYVIFEGKINLSDKDKNWKWEAFPQLTLLNGKETYIGGSVESTEGTTTTRIMTATWCLKDKPK